MLGRYRPALAASAAVCRRGGIGRYVLVLIAIDIGFLGLHVVSAFAERLDWTGELWSVMAGDQFRVNTDRGVSEYYEYVKTCLVIIILAIVYVRRRRPVYIALALGFAFMLVDNAIGGHERVGELVPFDPRLGQLAFMALAGFAVLFIVLLSWPRGDALDLGAAVISLLLVGVLGFFAAIVDGIHGLTAGVTSFVLRLLEEGGELMTLSIILAFLWSFARGSSHLEPESPPASIDRDAARRPRG